jgi:hypothetical protein
MRSTVLIALAIGVMSFQACEQNEVPATWQPKPLSDFSVRYSLYQSGMVYESDTFQTRFTVTNHGPSSFEVGDTLFAAVQLNYVVYGLDLIGSGPSAIVLSQPLPVGQAYEYNPGYLLRTPSLNYFATDTLDLTILLYGQSGSPIDPSFPEDPTPLNNRAILRLTTFNHYIVE